MSNISNQLIKDSYNNSLQYGSIFRIGGGIPINPVFLSGLTINTSFKYSNGSEQYGYVLTSDGFGNASWAPGSGSSSGDYLPLSGGTVSGRTNFISGLTANTISATTYQNLPIPIKLTSQTLSATSWSLSGGYYTYLFNNTNIDTTCDLSVTPQNNSYLTGYNAQVLPFIGVESGVATFYSQFPPQANMIVDIIITQTT